MISPRFPHLASLLASLMERILTDALLLLVLDGARRRKPVTKHKVVPLDDTRIWLSRERLKAEILLVSGRDLQARLSLHLSDPSYISLESWAPTPAQPVSPAMAVLLPQHRMLSRQSTPTRRGKEGLSSGKAFSPKSCQKLVTSNREERGRRNDIPAPALLYSPATTWRTFLTSNQGLKGDRLKGVWWEGI